METETTVKIRKINDKLIDIFENVKSLDKIEEKISEIKEINKIPAKDKELIKRFIDIRKNNLRPSNLILELNTACNNNCVYCLIPHKNYNKLDYLPKLTEEMKKARMKGIDNIDFSGGEPTIYPKAVSLIKYAKKIGFKNVNLVTNGRVLSDKRNFDRFLDAGVTRVIFSVDSSREDVQDKITRSLGSYKEMAAAMKLSKNYPNIDTGATVVISKLNYEHLSETVDYLRGFGLKFINLQYLLPVIFDSFNSLKLNGRVVPTYEEVRPHIEQVLVKDSKGKMPEDIHIHFVPFCKLPNCDKYIEPETAKYNRVVIGYKGEGFTIGDSIDSVSTKTEKCHGCVYNIVCIGFFERQKKIFGIENEFK